MNYFASLPFKNFPIRLTKKIITYRNSMIDVTSHVFISRLTTKKKVSIMSHLYITPYMLCSCHIYFFNTFFFYPLATPFQSHGTKQDRKPYTHFLPLFSELSENIYVFFFVVFFCSTHKLYKICAIGSTDHFCGIKASSGQYNKNKNENCLR